MAKSKTVAESPQDSPAPAVVPAGASLEDCVRALAQTVGAMATSQAKLTADLAGVIGDREEARRKEQAEIANQDRLRKEVEKSCQQRSQEIADRLWPVADDRYRVALVIAKKITNEQTGRRQTVIVPDDAFPVLQINAGSEDEAKGRYMRMCGITATEHRIEAVRVSELAQNAAQPGEWGAADESLPAGVEAA